jgi:ABC-type lipoprotein release transport system permease subunit
MTPSFRLLTGRMPRSGERELIAGDLAQRKFLDPDAGKTLYGDVEWKIVGTFTTGGWWDGYLVGDAAVVKAHAETTSADSIVLVKLTSPEAFSAFHAAAVGRLPPSVVAERETDYYASFWQSLPKSVLYVAFILSSLIAAGTIAGLTQIMHSSLEERRREIATLRILGFDGVAVAASVVLEGLLLALLGAVTATAVVWLWLDGRLYNGAWDVFRITVNLHLLLVAIGWSAAIALIGTLPLAYRAMRQGEWEALQELSEAGEPALTLTHPVWFAFWSRGGAALPAHTSA